MVKKNKNILLILIVLIFLTVMGFLVYQYVILKNQVDLQSQQSTKESIISNLTDLIILPDESNPKIATISNIDQLKNEDPEFYKNAVNGDTLIIFTSEAIIYRASVNKIVNVAQISQSNSNSTP